VRQDTTKSKDRTEQDPKLNKIFSREAKTIRRNPTLNTKQDNNKTEARLTISVPLPSFCEYSAPSSPKPKPSNKTKHDKTRQLKNNTRRRSTRRCDQGQHNNRSNKTKTKTKNKNKNKTKTKNKNKTKTKSKAYT
jgi:hypothetical protein